MWQISHSGFLSQIRPTLLWSWDHTPIDSAPKDLLPRTYAHYLDSLPAPRDVGLAFALLYHFAAALPVLLLQVPIDEDIDTFYDRVGDFNTTHSSKFAMNNIPPYLNLIELHNLVVETTIALLFIEQDPTAELNYLGNLLSTSAPKAKKLFSLQEHTWDVTLICLRALLETHFPLFRERWTNADFASFVNGFEDGISNGVNLSVPILPNPDTDFLDLDEYFIYEGNRDGELELEEDVYVPTGPRVPLDAFCQPIPPLSILQEVLCTICGTGVLDVEVGDETVVTGCQHYFHVERLGSWVNDSTMDNANTCPQCRRVMYEARARVLAEDGGERDDSDTEEDELMRYIRQLRGESGPGPAPMIKEELVREVDKVAEDVEDFLC
ncbi:hypothetical protein N0V87_008570 [Didymella glomerata]|uniref:RING-type domain-containing protein n=1 Tax=Didymella glomerata TaxID=749621 RepID=A0A9W9BW08_9PLEO|nr:hypothetical protein N0V87_008570 [Didymella glomerata]